MNNENKKEPSKEIIEEEYRLGKEYYNKLLKEMPNSVIFVSASALPLVLPNTLSNPNWALISSAVSVL